MSKKVNPVISSCPICKKELLVTKLECTHCDSKIEGSFMLSKFNYLETDKLYFIEIFIKNRGSIKAIEKELNISYPTVKKMLDDVILKLGYSLEQNEEEVPKKTKTIIENAKASILEEIEKGKISVEEAIATFRKIRKGE